MNDAWRTAKESIRSRIDLADLIGESVSLRGTGNRWKGLCPFHNEKTPSFHVLPDGFYKCFGCGRAGDVFQFVMETRGVSFTDAVQFLAERAGVEMPARGSRTEPKEDLHKARDLMTLVAHWYQQVLEKSPVAADARQYWLERNFSQEQMLQWQIGFAPEGDALARLLAKRQYPLEFAARFGVLQKRGSRFVDRLAGRLVFAIRNRYGQVCGFAGRSLSEQQQPKYLNSPQTPLFDKGNLLFGLAASLSLRQRDTVLLTEGYFDVLRSLAHGQATVAPMGTALTENQVHLIRRAFKTACLVFDGDAAGHKATLRSIPLLANGAIEVRVGSLADGTDLDNVASSGEAIQKILAESQPGIEFLINSMIPKQASMQQRQLAARELAKQLSTIDDTGLRKAGALQASELLGMPVELPPVSGGRQGQSLAKQEENDPKVQNATGEDSLGNLAVQLVRCASDNPTRTTELLDSEALELLSSEMIRYLEGEGPCPTPVASAMIQDSSASDTPWHDLITWGIRTAQRRHRKERIQRLENMAENARRAGDWTRYLTLIKSLENLAAEGNTDRE